MTHRVATLLRGGCTGAGSWRFSREVLGQMVCLDHPWNTRIDSLLPLAPDSTLRRKPGSGLLKVEQYDSFQGLVPTVVDLRAS